MSEAPKEIDKILNRFCKKLMGIPKCAASEFAEMKLGGESRRVKCIGQIVKYWYRIVRLDIEDPVKQCYKRLKRDRSVRSWTLELR